MDSDKEAVVDILSHCLETSGIDQDSEQIKRVAKLLYEATLVASEFDIEPTVLIEDIEDVVKILTKDFDG